MNLRQEHSLRRLAGHTVSSCPQLDCFAHSHFQALHNTSTLNMGQVIKPLCLENYSRKTTLWSTQTANNTEKLSLTLQRLSVFSVSGALGCLSIPDPTTGTCPMGSDHLHAIAQILIYHLEVFLLMLKCRKLQNHAGSPHISHRKWRRIRPLWRTNMRRELSDKFFIFPYLSTLP